MATREKDPKPQRHAEERRSMGEHLYELIDELTRLVRQEIALARAEMSEDIKQARSGATMLAVGAGLAASALVVLLLAGVYALSEIMHPGWAALVVGGVTLLIAAAIAKRGSNNLKAQNLMLPRTEESLRRDVDMAREEADETKQRLRQ